MLVCSLQNMLNVLIFSKKKSKTLVSLSSKRDGGQKTSLSMVLKTKPLEPPAPPRAHHRHQTSRRLHVLALAWSSVYILINYDWADGWQATSFHLFEPASIIVSWWWHLQPLQNDFQWGRSSAFMREKQHGGVWCGAVHTRLHIKNTQKKNRWKLHTTCIVWRL